MSAMAPGSDHDVARAMSMRERLALAKLEARIANAPAVLPIVGDRYVVQGVLGQGGMGEVVRAHDRALDRDVALKCLRAELGVAWAAAHCADEARALARLSHPNIVPVFDVIVDPLGVFVAMECVDGVDLRRWIAARSHAWQDVLDVAIGAGRGLAAVHAAGLVHGDMKPDNVLVGVDGRARVVDFGLARAQPLAVQRTIDGDDGEGTEPRAVHGTLGYLAPEQYEGAFGDACSDQLALCLTIFEALYGVRAVSSETLERARVDPGAWALRERPRKTTVPARVHAVLTRGAAVHRRDRFPSVDALVDALVDARRGRSPTTAIAVGVAVALGGLAAISLSHARPSAALDVPTDAPSDAVAHHRRGLDEAVALARAGASSEARALALAEADAARSAGESATALECERFAADLAVELGDYDVAARELAAVYYGSLEQRADAQAFEAAMSSASLLAHRMGRPRDAEPWLRHARAVLDAEARLDPRAPVDPQSSLAAARLAVAEADQWMLDARYAEAIARLGIAVDALESAALDDAGTIAGARNDLGLALHNAGEYARAIRQYELAAALVVDRLGPDHPEHARVLGNLGLSLAAVGRLDDAVRAHTQALAIRERALGPTHAHVGESLVNLGATLATLGRREEAEALELRALEVQERALGAEHPALAVTLNNLANLYEATDGAKAIAFYERALAIEERTKGPEHPDVAIVASNLAVALAGLDRLDDAAAWAERSLAIRERVFGHDHEQTAYALHNLGVIEQSRGRDDLAIPRLEAALVVRERSTDVGLRATTELSLAEALLHRDADPRRRRELASRAREGFRAAGRTDDAARADALTRS